MFLEVYNVILLVLHSEDGMEQHEKAMTTSNTKCHMLKQPRMVVQGDEMSLAQESTAAICQALTSYSCCSHCSSTGLGM